MAKVLLVANADSPLLVDRVKMSLNGQREVVWYSESKVRPEASCIVYHYKKIAFLGPLNKLLSAIFFVYVYWRMKPSIVHIHWALFLPLILKRRWKNLIVSVMGSDVNLPGRFGIRRVFARIAFDRAVAITSKSSAMDATINKLGNYSAKIRRITWGVSDEFFDAKPRRSKVRCSHSIPDDALVIFSPRAMQPLYRTPDITRAFVQFAAENKRAYLLMAGMNATESVVSEIDFIVANSIVPDRVIRLGFLGKQGMIDCYAAADIVVSYAQHDGMPQSLYEAMAVGCFPLFTDLPCYQEALKHQHNALLCDNQDAGALLQMLRYYQERYAGEAAESIVNTNRRYIRGLASKSSEQERLLYLYEELG